MCIYNASELDIPESLRPCSSDKEDLESSYIVGSGMRVDCRESTDACGDERV